MKQNAGEFWSCSHSPTLGLASCGKTSLLFSLVHVCVGSTKQGTGKGSREKETCLEEREAAGLMTPLRQPGCCSPFWTLLLALLIARLFRRIHARERQSQRTHKNGTEAFACRTFRRALPIPPSPYMLSSSSASRPDSLPTCPPPPRHPLFSPQVAQGALRCPFVGPPQDHEHHPLEGAPREVQRERLVSGFPPDGRAQRLTLALSIGSRSSYPQERRGQGHPWKVQGP